MNRAAPDDTDRPDQYRRILQVNHGGIEMKLHDVAIKALVVVGASVAGCGGSDELAGSGALPDESVVSHSTTTSSPTTSTSPGTTAAGPAVIAPLFTDDFIDDANAWGVVDDPQFGSASYDSGDYVWDFRGSVAHWLPGVLGEQYDRGELNMLDVVVRAELTIVDGTGVVGVFCRENPDVDAEWQWYEFVVRDGYAAIRLSDLEGNITALAESDAADVPTGSPFVIEATCRDDDAGDAQLSLSVDGAPLLEATVSEAPLGNGVVGLQAWTFPVHEPIEMRWHSFSVSEAGRGDAP